MSLVVRKRSRLCINPVRTRKRSRFCPSLDRSRCEIRACNRCFSIQGSDTIHHLRPDFSPSFSKPTSEDVGEEIKPYVISQQGHCSVSARCSRRRHDVLVPWADRWPLRAVTGVTRVSKESVDTSSKAHQARGSQSVLSNNAEWGKLVHLGPIATLYCSGRGEE